MEYFSCKIDMTYLQTARTMSWNKSDISIELIQMITFEYVFWQSRPYKFSPYGFCT